MSRFDEEPDGDIHGECAAEIAKLTAELSAAKLTIAKHEAQMLRMAQCAGEFAKGACKNAQDGLLFASAQEMLDTLQEAKHMFNDEYPGHPTTERIFAVIEKAAGRPA